MPSYRAPLSEYEFIVGGFLRLAPDCEQTAGLQAYDEARLGVFGDFLDAASQVCEGVALPLNHSGDREGCRLVDGSVEVPTGFKEAYQTFAAGGWIGLSLPEAHGGQGLPGVYAQIFSEMLCSANMAFSGYIELSEAVMAAILQHGSPEQHRTYLAPLASGRWTGAMHLTEAGAGSDLRHIATRAERQADGSYRLHGSKAFITNAEHNLAENIVHLVLARTPGSPPGTRGLSVFIVPKRVPGADGQPGRRNAVHVLSLEHKLGLRAAPTGVIQYDGAWGTLVGELNAGMRVIFTTVNDARLGVAIQGLAQAEVACQNAVAYARQRRQGADLAGNDPTHAHAIPIAGHPDVRRMLLTIRAFTEAARGAALWLAMHIDIAQGHPDPVRRIASQRLVSLLTPVVKAHFTDWGSEATNLALQCFGGYGYVQDTGVDQYVRDVRITQIYEGTNGIQALELVRRKLTMDDGAAVRAFCDLVRGAIDEASADESLRELTLGMKRGLADLEAAVSWHRECLRDSLIESAAGATDCLRLFGLVLLGWIWLRYAIVSAQALKGEAPDTAMLKRKQLLARYFITRILPETTLLLNRTRLGSGDLMSLDDDQL